MDDTKATLIQNRWYGMYISVGKTERVCPGCLGSGVTMAPLPIPTYTMYGQCPVCKGVGKLTWIDYITRPELSKLKLYEQEGNNG